MSDGTNTNVLDMFATRLQIDAVSHSEPKPTMFGKTFFNGSDLFFPTKKVEWDILRQGASSARIVSDKLWVEPTEIEPFIVKEFMTPKYQESMIIDLTTLFNRSFGENIYSKRTPADRAREAEAKAVAFCIDSVDRKREEMYAQMMVHGIIDLTGKGISGHIDFELPLKISLSGTSAWGQPGVDHMNDLVDYATKMRKRGHEPDMILMDLAVANVFLNDERLVKMLDNTRMNMGEIAPGPLTDLFETAQYFGTISWPGLGQIALYTYVGTYKNSAGEETPYLDEGRLLLCSQRSRQNRTVYGGEILFDEKDNPIFVEGRYIPEIFVSKKDRTKEIFVTSRGLPIPAQDDSWASIATGAKLKTT
jgi:hypothetical protein